jgi:hypothetical protein
VFTWFSCWSGWSGVGHRAPSRDLLVLGIGHRDESADRYACLLRQRRAMTGATGTVLDECEAYVS